MTLELVLIIFTYEKCAYFVGYNFFIHDIWV